MEYPECMTTEGARIGIMLQETYRQTTLERTYRSSIETISRLETGGFVNMVGLGPEEIRKHLMSMVRENVGVIKITKGDSGITSGIIGTVEKNGVFNRRYVVRDHHSRVQPEIDVEEEVLSGRYGFFSVV